MEMKEKKKKRRSLFSSLGIVSLALSILVSPLGPILAEAAKPEGPGRASLQAAREEEAGGEKKAPTSQAAEAKAQDGETRQGPKERQEDSKEQQTQAGQEAAKDREGLREKTQAGDRALTKIEEPVSQDPGPEEAKEVKADPAGLGQEGPEDKVAKRHKLTRPKKTIYVRKLNHLSPEEKTRVKEALVAATLEDYYKKSQSGQEAARPSDRMGRAGRMEGLDLRANKALYTREMEELEEASKMGLVEVSDKGEVKIIWKDHSQTVLDSPPSSYLAVDTGAPRISLSVQGKEGAGRAIVDSPDGTKTLQVGDKEALSLKIEAEDPEGNLSGRGLIIPTSLPPGLKVEMEANKPGRAQISGKLEEVDRKEGEDQRRYKIQVQAQDDFGNLGQEDLILLVGKGEGEIPPVPTGLGDLGQAGSGMLAGLGLLMGLVGLVRLGKKETDF